MTASREISDEAMATVLFGPDRRIVDDIIARIDAAQSRIDVCMFWFDYLPIADSLIAAQARGVAVRVLADQRSLAAAYDPVEERERPVSVPQLLLENGVDVRVYRADDHIFHHKLMTIDGSTVVFSTLNWHFDDIAHNADSYVVLEDHALCREVVGEIESWFQGSETAKEEDLPPVTRHRRGMSGRFRGLVARFRYHAVVAVLLFGLIVSLVQMAVLLSGR